jgi:hypothetical protein
MTTDGHAPATYVTLSDERFFLGTVALVNSLRLTGNDDPIVVIDAGLRPEQRMRLAGACELRQLAPPDDQVLPAFLKPAAIALGLDGTTVLVDGDMIVTDSLRPMVAAAQAGRICLLPDGPPRLQGRRFASWVDTLGLTAELRPQPYVNSGLIALRADGWARVLERWRELCEAVSRERSRLPHAIADDAADAHPFAYLDQDVLNAILMSEVAPERIHILDWQLAGVPEREDTTRIVDAERLHCENAHGRTMLLHHWVHPKPWFPGAHSHLRYAPYDELLARLLTADDVPVRLRPAEVPPWMRRGPVPHLMRCAARSRLRPMRLLRTVRSPG